MIEIQKNNDVTWSHGTRAENSKQADTKMISSQNSTLVHLSGL